MIYTNSHAYYTQKDTDNFTCTECTPDEIEFVTNAYLDTNFPYLEIVKGVTKAMLVLLFIFLVISWSKVALVLFILLATFYVVTEVGIRQYLSHKISKENVVRYEAIVLKKYDPIPIDGLTAVYPVAVRDALSKYRTVLYVPESVYIQLDNNSKFWRHRLLNTNQAI